LRNGNDLLGSHIAYIWNVSLHDILRHAVPSKRFMLL
jgi:hypothetical protein